MTRNTVIKEKIQRTGLQTRPAAEGWEDGDAATAAPVEAAAGKEEDQGS